MSDLNTVTSVEQDGRTLSGVGVSHESLEAVMDRHVPDETAPEPSGVGAAAGTDSPVAAPAPSEPKPSRGAQRFSDLTKARDEAKAETESERTKRVAAEQRIADLEAKLAQATTPQQQQQAQQQLTQEHQRQQQPARFTFPKYEEFILMPGNEGVDYDTWQDLKADARDQWKDSQRPPVQQVVSQVLDADRQARTWQEIKEQTQQRARAVYKDFDAMWTSGPGAGVIQHPDQMAAILKHPQSEHIQYAILKDRDLAIRLAQMPPVDFGMAIERLAPPPQVSRQPSNPPPAPYQPVGGGSPTTSVPSSELAAKGFDFDKSGYREQRAAERKTRPRY